MYSRQFIENLCHKWGIVQKISPFERETAAQELDSFIAALQNVPCSVPDAYKQPVALPWHQSIDVGRFVAQGVKSMAYKMSIDEAIEVLNDVVRYPDDFTEDQIDAIKISLKGLKDMMRFAVANAELATLNATLIEFVSEVNYTPYSDSNYLSLLETLRSRASAILQDITSAQHGVPPVSPEVTIQNSQFMFEGMRKDGKGVAKGYFFVWHKRGVQIPMIGDGVQNGSVYGDEVLPETVRPLQFMRGKNG